eukprot:CAMPEP_0179139220 /NCGR_PEP_ID=MMETSP0796-20121207/66567_1 /TAXON_ID=73915 /ORGANISM="Pyrodinium bahamense, Strain pbaha01" /LENGTH=93 /DNA_ID=CAMNT_0020838623 /DNA_START=21 /DNA_END=298 /DNA_ORIENTATION=-
MNGLTKGELVIDVFVTILLAFSAVATLLVGWQRFAVVRALGVLRARRLSVWPVFAVFVGIAGVCSAATVIRQPKRLQDWPLPDAWQVGLGQAL